MLRKSTLRLWLRPGAWCLDRANNNNNSINNNNNNNKKRRNKNKKKKNDEEELNHALRSLATVTVSAPVEPSPPTNSKLNLKNNNNNNNISPLSKQLFPDLHEAEDTLSPEKHKNKNKKLVSPPAAAAATASRRSVSSMEEIERRRDKISLADSEFNVGVTERLYPSLRRLSVLHEVHYGDAVVKEVDALTYFEVVRQQQQQQLKEEKEKEEVEGKEKNLSSSSSVDVLSNDELDLFDREMGTEDKLKDDDGDGDGDGDGSGNEMITDNNDNNKVTPLIKDLELPHYSKKVRFMQKEAFTGDDDNNNNNVPSWVRTGIVTMQPLPLSDLLLLLEFLVYLRYGPLYNNNNNRKKEWWSVLPLPLQDKVIASLEVESDGKKENNNIDNNKNNKIKKKEKSVLTWSDVIQFLDDAPAPILPYSESLPQYHRHPNNNNNNDDNKSPCFLVVLTLENISVQNAIAHISAYFKVTEQSFMTHTAANKMSITSLLLGIKENTLTRRHLLLLNTLRHPGFVIRVSDINEIHAPYYLNNRLPHKKDNNNNNNISVSEQLAYDLSSWEPLYSVELLLRRVDVDSEIPNAGTNNNNNPLEAVLHQRLQFLQHHGAVFFTAAREVALSKAATDVLHRYYKSAFITALSSRKRKAHLLFKQFLSAPNKITARRALPVVHDATIKQCLKIFILKNGNYKTIVSSLPFAFRRRWYAALCSRTFNILCSERIKLVHREADDDYNHNYNHKAMIGDIVVKLEYRQEVRRKQIITLKQEMVTVVRTAEEAALYSLDDVCIPFLKGNKHYPREFFLEREDEDNNNNNVVRHPVTDYETLLAILRKHHCPHLLLGLEKDMKEMFHIRVDKSQVVFRKLIIKPISLDYCILKDLKSNNNNNNNSKAIQYDAVNILQSPRWRLNGDVEDNNNNNGEENSCSLVSREEVLDQTSLGNYISPMDLSSSSHAQETYPNNNNNNHNNNNNNGIEEDDDNNEGEEGEKGNYLVLNKAEKYASKRKNTLHNAFVHGKPIADDHHHRYYYSIYLKSINRYSLSGLHQMLREYFLLNSIFFEEDSTLQHKVHRTRWELDKTENKLLNDEFYCSICFNRDHTIQSSSSSSSVDGREECAEYLFKRSIFNKENMLLEEVQQHQQLQRISSNNNNNMNSIPAFKEEGKESITSVELENNTTTTNNNNNNNDMEANPLSLKMEIHFHKRKKHENWGIHLSKALFFKGVEQIRNIEKVKFFFSPPDTHNNNKEDLVKQFKQRVEHIKAIKEESLSTNENNNHKKMPSFSLSLEEMELYLDTANALSELKRTLHAPPKHFCTSIVSWDASSGIDFDVEENTENNNNNNNKADEEEDVKSFESFFRIHIKMKQYPLFSELKFRLCEIDHDENTPIHDKKDVAAIFLKKKKEQCSNIILTFELILPPLKTKSSSLSSLMTVRPTLKRTNKNRNIEQMPLCMDEQLKAVEENLFENNNNINNNNNNNGNGNGQQEEKNGLVYGDTLASVLFQTNPQEETNNNNNQQEEEGRRRSSLVRHLLFETSLSTQLWLKELPPQLTMVLCKNSQMVMHSPSWGLLLSETINPSSSSSSPSVLLLLLKNFSTWMIQYIFSTHSECILSLVERAYVSSMEVPNDEKNNDNNNNPFKRDDPVEAQRIFDEVIPKLEPILNHIYRVKRINGVAVHNREDCIRVVQSYQQEIVLKERNNNSNNSGNNNSKKKENKKESDSERYYLRIELERTEESYEILEKIFNFYEKNLSTMNTNKEKDNNNNSEKEKESRKSLIDSVEQYGMALLEKEIEIFNKRKQNDIPSSAKTVKLNNNNNNKEKEVVGPLRMTSSQLQNSFVTITINRKIINDKTVGRWGLRVEPFSTRLKRIQQNEFYSFKVFSKKKSQARRVTENLMFNLYKHQPLSASSFSNNNNNNNSNNISFFLYYVSAVNTIPTRFLFPTLKHLLSTSANPINNNNNNNDDDDELMDASLVNHERNLIAPESIVLTVKQFPLLRLSIPITFHNNNNNNENRKLGLQVDKNMFITSVTPHSPMARGIETVCGVVSSHNNNNEMGFSCSLQSYIRDVDSTTTISDNNNNNNEEEEEEKRKKLLLIKEKIEAVKQKRLTDPKAFEQNSNNNDDDNNNIIMESIKTRIRFFPTALQHKIILVSDTLQNCLSHLYHKTDTNNNNNNGNHNFNKKKFSIDEDEEEEEKEKVSASIVEGEEDSDNHNKELLILSSLLSSLTPLIVELEKEIIKVLHDQSTRIQTDGVVVISLMHWHNFVATLRPLLEDTHNTHFNNNNNKEEEEETDDDNNNKKNSILLSMESLWEDLLKQLEVDAIPDHNNNNNNNMRRNSKHKKIRWKVLYAAKAAKTISSPNDLMHIFHNNNNNNNNSGGDETLVVQQCVVEE